MDVGVTNRQPSAEFLSDDLDHRRKTSLALKIEPCQIVCYCLIVTELSGCTRFEPARTAFGARSPEHSTLATTSHASQSVAMSDHGDLSACWHDAAESASFAFYEPSNGNERWAGGFASDGSQIEVIALVDGDEVSVETSRAERALPDGVRRRHSIGEMLWRHALEGDAQSTLPYSVTIDADDRAVTVDGELHTVPGMRVKGDPRSMA